MGRLTQTPCIQFLKRSEKSQSYWKNWKTCAKADTALERRERIKSGVGPPAELHPDTELLLFDKPCSRSDDIMSSKRWTVCLLKQKRCLCSFSQYISKGLVWSRNTQSAGILVVLIYSVESIIASDIKLLILYWHVKLKSENTIALLEPVDFGLKLAVQKLS